MANRYASPEEIEAYYRANPEALARIRQESPSWLSDPRLLRFAEWQDRLWDSYVNYQGTNTTEPPHLLTGVSPGEWWRRQSAPQPSPEEIEAYHKAKQPAAAQPAAAQPAAAQPAAAQPAAAQPAAAQPAAESTVAPQAAASQAAASQAAAAPAAAAPAEDELELLPNGSYRMKDGTVINGNTVRFSDGTAVVVVDDEGNIVSYEEKNVPKEGPRTTSQGIPHITQQAKFSVNPQAQLESDTSININPLEIQEGYYREPWYNPNVSNTVQVGTPSSNIRGPQQIMAGYDPRDGRYARGYYVDQYGNVTVPYDRQYLQYIDPYGRIPQGVYAAAPNRDPRWHWSVINAEDAALRQAGGLYLDKIEAAFDRVVNGIQGGPELYQVQPGTVQERPYYREDAGWMIQPLFKMPSRRVSDGEVIEGTGGGLQIESNPIMDAAGVPLSLQEHGANVYHAMLSRGYDEWTATRAALKAMMDADSGFNADAYLRTAMAHARGMSDNPQYNYMNNLGWDASSIQAQKKTSELS